MPKLLSNHQTKRHPTASEFEIEVIPKDKLTFQLGTRQAPVGVVLRDSITLGNGSKKPIDFKVLSNSNEKYAVAFEHDHGTINPVRYFVFLFLIQFLFLFFYFLVFFILIFCY